MLRVLALAAAAETLRCTLQRAAPRTPRFASAKMLETLPGQWRLNFNLPGANTNVVMRARFSDDKGFEPPQGRVLFDRGDGFTEVGRWMLSEDPDDRKDGLWVWGLFAEPLYPFLLMMIPSESVGLPDGGTLVCRINHKARPDDDAQLLTRGVVSARKRTSVGAGLSRVSINEDIALGTIVCSQAPVPPIAAEQKRRKDQA